MVSLATNGTHQTTTMIVLGVAAVLFVIAFVMAQQQQPQSALNASENTALNNFFVELGGTTKMLAVLLLTDIFVSRVHSILCNSSNGNEVSRLLRFLSKWQCRGVVREPLTAFFSISTVTSTGILIQKILRVQYRLQLPTSLCLLNCTISFFGAGFKRVLTPNHFSHLGNNKFVGAIPLTIAALKSLRHLCVCESHAHVCVLTVFLCNQLNRDIAQNQLSGIIPTAIGQLNKLTYL